MVTVARQTAEFLRGHGRFHPAASGPRAVHWPVAVILVGAPIYGAVMGSFALDSAERLGQVAYSAAKAPLLLAATTALCLPGFFVLNTVLGLRDDFRAALHAVLSGQAGLSIALVSLAPLTRFWYFSVDSYRAALLFNAAMFTLATLAGQIVIARYYRPLIRKNRRHRAALYVWVVLYALVGIQMGWVLRPFVGTPGLAVTFFREKAFTNAYVEVAGLIFGGY